MTSGGRDYTLLDLFSGIGGFSLGLERAGFTTVAFCEIEPSCQVLLKHWWPDVPCFADINTLGAPSFRDKTGLSEVFAICGGFPCQDISLAGLGAGINGSRSGLWKEYARLIRIFRPQLVFVENVSALLSRGLGTVLGDLAALGYDAWWDCIPASAVGAPHRRDRLWIVAYARSEQHEGYGDALRRAVASELSLAYAAGDGWEQEQSIGGWGAPRVGTGTKYRPRHGGAALADADGSRCQQQRWPQPIRAQLPAAECSGRRRPEPGLGRMVDGLSHRLDRLHGLSLGWQEEPAIPRIASGVASRVDRLHGLGNAVVPAIPEILGRAALSALSSLSHGAAA